MAEDRNDYTYPMLQNREQAGGRRTRAAEDPNFLGIIGLLICAAPGDLAGTTAEVRPRAARSVVLQPPSIYFGYEK